MIPNRKRNAAEVNQPLRTRSAVQTSPRGCDTSAWNSRWLRGKEGVLDDDNVNETESVCRRCWQLNSPRLGVYANVNK